MNIYMIQRGNFKNINYKNITGFDSLISLQYMGSSEFEYGIVPQALRRFVEIYKNKKMVLKDVEIQGNKFTITGPLQKDEFLQIVKLFEDQLKQDKTFRLQESTHFDYYINDRNNGLAPDFWWDIENDWFMFPYDKLSEIEKAIIELQKKWYK